MGPQEVFRSSRTVERMRDFRCKACVKGGRMETEEYFGAGDVVKWSRGIQVFGGCD